MHELELVLTGAPPLHAPCTPVQEGLFGSPALLDLVSEMRHRLGPWSAVGLAAPQVGESMAVFVVDDSIGLPQVWINPVVERMGKSPKMMEEGCLSIPGKLLRVMRAQKVRYTARDEHGETFRGEAYGYAARVLQHEYDHLQGLLIEDTWIGAKR